MNAREKNHNEGPISRADNPAVPVVPVPPVAAPAAANRPARGAAGKSHKHESARAQVAGSATYVDDILEARGTLYAAPILSTIAHGRLRGVDATAALAMPGVRGVVLADDIPGDPL
ncbi:MAG: xanthine dehydrogenase molybdopterin binding subunit, partial [Polaromonas sp.]|nr:xanthine dehydrogenase molybdopterin binding subunit [Polaromonas sp.]